jgi:hypothetical protein
VIPDPKNKDLPKLLTACGAAIIAPRRNSIFPRIATPDTVRKWLRTWFYVKNSGEEDLLNLPGCRAIHGPGSPQVSTCGRTRTRSSASAGTTSGSATASTT